jgi:hypothetical protein
LIGRFNVNFPKSLWATGSVTRITPGQSVSKRCPPLLGRGNQLHCIDKLRSVSHSINRDFSSGVFECHADERSCTLDEVLIRQENSSATAHAEESKSAPLRQNVNARDRGLYWDLPQSGTSFPQAKCFGARDSREIWDYYFFTGRAIFQQKRGAHDLQETRQRESRIVSG